MVLDASGSMAWTAGEPQQIFLTSDQLNSITVKNGPTNSEDEDASHFLSAADVDKLLVNTKTDSTAIGYNGYHYYIYDPRDTVLEYVALGYVDDKAEVKKQTGSDKEYATLSSGEKVIANRWKNYGDKGSYDESNWPGWYYVNSSQSPYNPTGKSYDGLGGRGHVLFYIKNNNELWCRFFTSNSANQGEHAKYGTVNKGYSDSPVFEKRETMFTKNETLQDSIAQFGTILLGSSPDSQIAMTRFSTSNLASDKLPLLNWTSSTVKVVGALDQTPNSEMLKPRDTSVAGLDNGGSSVTTYEYGLTGQTHTVTGVNAFSTYLDRKNGAETNNEKYLIIFTDGKDNNTSNDSSSTTQGLTGNAVRALQNSPANYKVITVVFCQACVSTLGMTCFRLRSRTFFGFRHGKTLLTFLHVS